MRTPRVSLRSRIFTATRREDEPAEGQREQQIPHDWTLARWRPGNAMTRAAVRELSTLREISLPVLSMVEPG